MGLSPINPARSPVVPARKKENEVVQSLSSFSYGSSSSGDIRINLEEPPKPEKGGFSSGLIKLRQVLPKAREMYKKDYE